MNQASQANTMETQPTSTVMVCLRTGGHRIWRHKKIWLLWWLCNLGAALLVIAPLIAAFQSFVGRSLAGQRLPSAFDIHTILEFFRANPSLPRSSLVLLFGVIVGYALLLLFLLSGSIHLLRKASDPSADTRYTVGAYLRDALHYFPRLLRLFVFSLLFYGAYLYAYRKWGRWLDSFVTGSIYEAPVAYLRWLKMSLLLVGFASIKIFFDVVKIKLIVDDTTSAVKAVWHTLKMCSFRISRVFGIFIATALLSFGIGWLIRMGIARNTDQTLGSVFMIFCLHQIFLLARIGTQLLYYSATTVWYEALQSKSVYTTGPETPKITRQATNPLALPEASTIAPLPANDDPALS